jgi:hypothetical protein
MNKHIIPYTHQLNESIGKGSVLLIKGRQMENGRLLYVTAIKGFVEIKPGIKMVFIGDEIYRVVHKGGDKFSGKKVDYRGEDGLKGVFNMKSPGKPSVVLNHNKTPFHWITLNHLDIGKALRELGPRLFNHELILESYNKEEDKDLEAKNFLLRETVKLITGQNSVLKLMTVKVDEGGEDLTDVEDDEGTIGYYETDIALTFNADKDDIPIEYHDYVSEYGMFPFDIGLDSLDMDILELDEVSGMYINIRYTTDAQVRHSYDPGDWNTPPSGDSEVSDVDTTLTDDPFTIEGDYAIAPDDIKSELEVYNKMIEEDDPSELVTHLKQLVHGKVIKIGGIERDSKITLHLRSLYYNYSKALIDLKKNGLSEEAKRKWSKIDSFKIDDITKQVNDIIAKQKELEKIALDEGEEELTQDQLNLSRGYFDAIHTLVPSSNEFEFCDIKGPGHAFEMMNYKAIMSALNIHISTIRYPDKTKINLEHELIKINYQKTQYDALNKEYPDHIHKRDKKLDFYLNRNDIA